MTRFYVLKYVKCRHSVSLELQFIQKYFTCPKICSAYMSETYLE